MISGDQVQRPEQYKPQQLDEEQAAGRRWRQRGLHGGQHVVHVVRGHGGDGGVGGRVVGGGGDYGAGRDGGGRAPLRALPAVGEHATSVLQVLVADGEFREEADQEAAHGAAGALGDAAGARVPGQHAHRLVQLQPAELLGVRRADGRPQLPVGRGDRVARERGHVRAERPVRVRAEATRDARSCAHHVPAVQPHRGVLRRAAPDMLQRERGLGPVHVADRVRPTEQRVRGGRGDRHTHGQHEDALQDGVLQLDEPRVERDVHVPRAVRRARVRPVRGG